MAGMSVNAAILVSIIVESILYGLLIFLFGVTVRALIYQRTSAEISISRLMLGTACLLFILGTMRLAVDSNHLWQGFITSGDPYLFFQDVTKYTFKNSLYVIETVVGDAIIIYRGYILWQRIDIIIIPIIGWIATVVTGFHAVWSISQLSTSNADVLYGRQASQWVVSFYSTALATNFVATGILIFKLWAGHRNQVGLQRPHAGKSLVRPIVVVIMECGAVYSLSLIAMLSLYKCGSNGVYIMIDVIGQIIPITFCVIIVRTATPRFERDRGHRLPLNPLTYTGGHQISKSHPVRVQMHHAKVVESDLRNPFELSRRWDAWDGSPMDTKSELPITNIAQAV
ncbi:hypothetical protein PAXRUDRAFT_834099 [Paxillus rubicundulus Ve08.2h10]|uniref:Unplaced genomic scaffold scaffold_1460, whole genome shotgun sequence n=1 Tax=Paxillus rubicundulus Ve08.2h10 TaxID=930991 RepID=A0A0D0C9A1_9AGAM|nr:hypothetical protein PAXRUDRAFT_834099 [Paxillus rubicundulus Ve08.2h10]